MKSIILIIAASLAFTSCLSTRSTEYSQVPAGSSYSASSTSSAEVVPGKQLTTQNGLQDHATTEVIVPGGDSKRSVDLQKETK